MSDTQEVVNFTAHRELDLFLSFSSIVGTMGNAGQANHAAANAWSGLGEAEEQRERITRQPSAFGGGWFTPQQGRRALDRLVRRDPATAVVMAGDLHRAQHAGVRLPRRRHAGFPAAGWPAARPSATEHTGAAAS